MKKSKTDLSIVLYPRVRNQWDWEAGRTGEPLIHCSEGRTEESQQITGKDGAYRKLNTVLSAGWAKGCSHSVCATHTQDGFTLSSPPLKYTPQTVISGRWNQTVTHTHKTVLLLSPFKRKTPDRELWKKRKEKKRRNEHFFKKTNKQKIKARSPLLQDQNCINRSGEILVLHNFRDQPATIVWKTDHLNTVF